ncbi:MAG: phospholipid carrier-dependent glycosyltransferase [Crenarchaeota archaeon]|nr:phospholipid carrier-dependent glycosyltransferase [Thermoproteota archaeon]
MAYIHQYVRPLGASTDEYQFEEDAWNIAANGFGSLFDKNTEISSGFSWFAGAIYIFIGREPFAIQAINVFAGMLTVYYVYRIALFCSNDKRKALFISSVIAFFPSFSLISSLFLRDSYLIFLITYSFYKYLMWLSTGKSFYLLMNILGLVLASMLHGAMLLFIGVELILETFKIANYSNVSFSKKFIAYMIIAIVVAGTIVYAEKILSNPKIQIALMLFQNDPSVLKRLGGEIIKSEAFISQYPAPSGNDFFSLIKHTPYRVFYFLTTPWPTMYGKITDIPRILDSMLVTILLILLIIRRKHFVKFKFKNSFYILFFTFSTMFAFGTFDVLTGQRHRLKIIPVFTAVTLSFVLPRKKVH